MMVAQRRRLDQELVERGLVASRERARAMVRAGLVRVAGVTMGEPDQMAKVERTLLRIATFEIRYLPSVPLKAAINESIELAKTFGGPDSGKFVNGILGRIAADAEIRRPPADQAATREAS